MREVNDICYTIFFYINIILMCCTQQTSFINFPFFRPSSTVYWSNRRGWFSCLHLTQLNRLSPQQLYILKTVIFTKPLMHNCISNNIIIMWVVNMLHKSYVTYHPCISVLNEYFNVIRIYEINQSNAILFGFLYIHLCGIFIRKLEIVYFWIWQKTTIFEKL